MSNLIRTGLLAYGMSGKVFHAPFLAAHHGFELTAVVERNTKKAAADYPSIKSYDSIEAILADPAIDLIVVNTPNYLHFEHCKAALEAGKHILVEKPFVPTAAGAITLFKLAQQRELKVMVYQNRRYSSDFLSAREVIESGVLGNIIEAHFRFDRYKAAIGPKFFKEQPYPASGIVYDLGAHLIDQVISVFGTPLSFNKTTGRYREGSQVDDFGHIHLRYPEQKNVFVTVSMQTADPQTGIVIHGTKGSFTKPFCDVQEDQSIAGIKPDDPAFGVEKPGNEGMLTTVDPSGGKHQQRVPGKKGNMMGIFEAVYQAITHNAPFPVKEDQVIEQLEILES